MSMLPSELQDIVFQNMHIEQDYKRVKDKGVSLVGHRIQMASPTPMDIGAVSNSSEHCNHDHSYYVSNCNGEPEIEIGQVRGYGKGNMQCYDCGGYGHIARDCPKPRQPKDYGKGQHADGCGKGLQ